MAEGKLSFLSFVRRGLATALSTADTAPAGAEHTVITLQVTPGLSTSDTLFAKVDLSLTGPGDIVGLNPAVVVRTWPKPDDFDAEFIPYPLIEFDQADLPWRYTPATRTGDPGAHTDHLRSWFSLVVVPATLAKIDPPTPKQKLPILTVGTADLPNPLDLWAFAHTQFTGENLSDQAVKSQITGPPGQFVARLISPRLLQPKTEYVACLVPTFERGRLIGTGGTLDQVDALTAAWGADPTVTSVQLPVYFSWRFATGTVGSFEQAARLITATPLPATIGRRDMDVLDPGLGLPAASVVDPTIPSNGSLPVEGALLSAAAFLAGRPAWPTAQRGIFLPALTALVNKPADKNQLILVPPLYGQWYAASDRLPAVPPTPSVQWFYDLNSDPRERVAAAQGTAVIQREQEALLAAGWDQVAEVRTVNDKLRVLQLGRGTWTQIFSRHFKGMSIQRFYHLTLKVHSRVKCGDKTVCDRVDGSPLVPGFLSSQWIRWSSPRSRIGRVQGRPALTGQNPGIIGLLNDCRKPAPEPPPPTTTHDPGDVPGGIPCDRIDDLSGLGTEVLERWGLVIMWVVRNLTFTQNGDCWWIAIKAIRYAIWLIRIIIDPGDVKRRCKWASRTLTAQDFLDARPRPGLDLSVFANPEVPDAIPSPGIPGLPNQIDSTDAAALRAALVRMYNLTALPAQQTCPPPMDLDTCKVSLETTLEPEVTVGKRVIGGGRLIIDGVSWQPKDPLEPMHAPPEYERPMYEPLARVSQDWILPGLDSMKRDSAGLAVMNQRFIEAYMAGLNHEMTRELLWNEFPTDQRGTYFRQFWDIAGNILEDGSSLPPDQLRDVKPLRQWLNTAALGDNSPRPLPLDPTTGQPAPFLVLVVRAQLIQKYPNVIVYAQKVTGTGANQTLMGPQTHPVFYALMKPDIAFYGFPLTLKDIQNDPSWFFVLQEQPGEPKFAEEGADRTTKNFTDPGSIVLLSDVDNKPIDPPAVAKSASQLAATTFQEPFRVGIQATAMLPDT